jgi:predicted Zn-dependent protease
LQWLSGLSSDVQTRQPVPLVITDCQIALKDWANLAATVEKEDWGGAETIRLAVESLAQRSLGHEEDAQSLWRQVSRESARNLDTLYQLIQLTSAWGWEAERKAMLFETVKTFPQENWAVQALLATLHDTGETQELENLLSKLSSANPGNVELKGSLARVRLLRKSDLSGACKLAKEAYDKAPDNPLMISTYAYALLLQGQRNEAVIMLDNLKPQALEIPWVATCYGVIEAQSGHKEIARSLLERAQAAKLLPEEMELVRQARETTY